METKNRTRRREAILQAAFTEFCSNGYDRATMEEIARRAGIGKSTVYEYFPSKMDLLTATGDFVLDQIFLDAERMLSPDRPLRAALADYLEYVSSFMGQFGPSFFHMAGDRAVTRVVHRLCVRHMKTVSAYMETVLRAAQQRGEVAANLDVRTVASLLVTLPNPPFVRMAAKGQLHTAIEPLIDFLMQGLAPR